MQTTSIQLSGMMRALCWFRGVAPAYLAKHRNEAAILTTQAIAMLVPMVVAGINGGLMAMDLGAGTLGIIGGAVGVALLVYGMERVLITMTGNGEISAIPSIALRIIIAFCLAFLLGEGITSGVLFKDRIAEYFRKQGEQELVQARTIRDEAQKAAEAWRTNRLAPLEELVKNRRDVLAAALNETEDAQKQVLNAKALLLDEEEGRAASGIKERGRRFTEKEKTYHEPALARQKAAIATQNTEKELLEQSQSELKKVVQEPSLADETLRAAEVEYQRKVADMKSQSHHDLGSRLTAMLALAKENPVLGFIYVLAVTLFICIDMVAVLGKFLGRKTAYDLEEAHETKMTQLRLEAEINAFEMRNPQIAELRSESVLRGVISQTAREESLTAIREAIAYQREVAAHRQSVVEALERAEASQLSDVGTLCRNTLETIDYWADRGLKRMTTLVSNG